MEQNEAKRSEFVTMLAWVFIGLSALTAAAAVAQMVLVWTVFPSELFQAPAPGQAPPTGAQFLYANLRPLATGFCLLALAALGGSIGLLKRRNWGRLLIIGLLGIAILWNFAGFGVQLYTLNSFPALPAGAQQARPFLHFVLVFSALFLLAFSALFAWLIKKLLSPEIVEEFGCLGGMKGKTAN